MLLSLGLSIIIVWLNLSPDWTQPSILLLAFSGVAEHWSAGGNPQMTGVAINSWSLNTLVSLLSLVLQWQSLNPSFPTPLPEHTFTSYFQEKIKKPCDGKSLNFSCRICIPNYMQLHDLPSSCYKEESAPSDTKGPTIHIFLNNSLDHLSPTSPLYPASSNLASLFIILWIFKHALVSPIFWKASHWTKSPLGYCLVSFLFTNQVYQKSFCDSPAFLPTTLLACF